MVFAARRGMDSVKRREKGIRAGLGRCGRWLFAAVAVLLIAACNNNPHPDGLAGTNTLFSGVVESSPKHFDPTASYWSNDTPFTYQIYEPLYGYHLLKRPFALVPKVATEVVQPIYLDKDGQRLPPNVDGALVAESVYEIPIRRGVRFEPHPAFAKDEQGRHRYHAMQPGELGKRRIPHHFEHTGTRELVAEDYVYALKRHATTRITTPIAGIFSEYVIGLKDYMALIKAEDAKLRLGLARDSLDKPFLDFRRWPLAGATAPESHLLRIRIHGKYPQWNYWMSMTFIAPVPWEADAFYAQPGMAAVGLTLDAWPVGTGPYRLVESIQDRRHVMERNPNYRGEPFPCEGMPGDREAGRLDDCGKTMPFIDRMVFTIDKEGVPQKAKFRQGYYDIEVFERTDTGMDYLVDMQDSEESQALYTERGYRLPKEPDISSWIIGFNMLDPVIGQGSTPEQAERNRKLRQAISIAIDWEEFSQIFPKHAGQVAMGPLPAGLFGSRHNTPEDLNPVTHRRSDGQLVRRPIDDAKKLMVDAGYPGGRDAKTGRPLVINYDYYAIPTPARRAEIDWVVKQLAKIDIQVEVRATDNNQFQDKIRGGKHQMFWLGWLADYPDAENFLFLLYGPNGKTRSDGENTSNYENPEFDRLFSKLKLLDDGPEKQATIDRLVQIVQQDAPWSFGYFPYATSASQAWLHNTRPSVMIRDPGRYMRLDVAERVRRQAEWNRPVWWPVVLGLLILVGVVALAVHSFRQRERLDGRGRVVTAQQV
jgi:ABC-type transport system substrate-binding protein